MAAFESSTYQDLYNYGLQLVKTGLQNMNSYSGPSSLRPDFNQTVVAIVSGEPKYASRFRINNSSSVINTYSESTINNNYDSLMQSYGIKDKLNVKYNTKGLIYFTCVLARFMIQQIHIHYNGSNSEYYASGIIYNDKYNIIRTWLVNNMNDDVDIITKSDADAIITGMFENFSIGLLNACIPKVYEYVSSSSSSSCSSSSSSFIIFMNL
jgi:hypothetical protein